LTYQPGETTAAVLIEALGGTLGLLLGDADDVTALIELGGLNVAASRLARGPLDLPTILGLGLLLWAVRQIMKETKLPLGWLSVLSLAYPLLRQLRPSRQLSPKPTPPTSG